MKCSNWVSSITLVRDGNTVTVFDGRGNITNRSYKTPESSFKAYQRCFSVVMGNNRAEFCDVTCLL